MNTKQRGSAGSVLLMLVGIAAIAVLIFGQLTASAEDGYYVLT